MTEYAEKYAMPFEMKLYADFPKKNDFNDLFYIRRGKIKFNILYGTNLNLKVIIRVYRNTCCETFLSDTDPYEIKWNRHKRVTRKFFIHPLSVKTGKIICVKFSFIVHLDNKSIPSEFEYLFMKESEFFENKIYCREITMESISKNEYRTYEAASELLQRDVDWHNKKFESLKLIPKFTKGLPYHPYHPKRFIHDNIDAIIQRKKNDFDTFYSIKVAVDCIDDCDFINHLIYASRCGVYVQCIVDWRKMTLTNSENYYKLKCSGVELLGVFCMSDHPLVEVAPDMHAKFIIFGDEACICGSFNITFYKWGTNWETGMTFNSKGICRLFDNIFQSLRGGYIQGYGVDPLSNFNLLYTFGRHYIMNGKNYLPHISILSELNRAKKSIKLCLFIINELRGEYGESIIDLLKYKKKKGIEIQIILNGHIARQGNPGIEYTMKEELERPLLHCIQKLIKSEIPVFLVYGNHDRPIPYSPLHQKFCVIDDTIVIDGSFNWYNTSVFSHDFIVVVSDTGTAAHYIFEFEQILKSFRYCLEIGNQSHSNFLVSS